MYSLFVGIVGAAGDAVGRRGDLVLIWYWSMAQSSTLEFGRCGRRVQSHRDPGQLSWHFGVPGPFDMCHMLKSGATVRVDRL
jgi:hypothetical protein